jgi:hypothetical protein
VLCKYKSRNKRSMQHAKILTSRIIYQTNMPPSGTVLQIKCHKKLILNKYA